MCFRWVISLWLLWGGGPIKGADPEPAPWGGDHVGRELPDYVSGDECLFCHRDNVAPNWPDNPHLRTMRLLGWNAAWSDLPNASWIPESVRSEIQFILGSTNRVRFLKRSGRYGHLDLLDLPRPEGGSPLNDAGSHWQRERFAVQCAGCHTTAVDGDTLAFSAIGVDCYACHGDVDLDHTKGNRPVLLPKRGGDPARVVISICASCHVRTGRSRSLGTPYPNQFVPGDNVFRDFEVDWSDAAIAASPPIDRHVLANARDVVVRGEDTVTCLSCHLVHQDASFRHRRLETTDLCWTCHDGSVRTLISNWNLSRGSVCDQ